MTNTDTHTQTDTVAVGATGTVMPLMTELRCSPRSERPAAADAVDTAALGGSVA